MCIPDSPRGQNTGKAADQLGKVQLVQKSGQRPPRVPMARIAKTNTKPEVEVRRIAHQLGYRFRLHRKDLPGTPDLAFPRLKKTIFVHGCFWHRHSCKDGRKIPSGNQAYWLPKFERNKVRDTGQEAQLKKLGWSVLTIWECELRSKETVAERIAAFLKG